ncbi:hypothetical protein [Humibacter sp. RRB41]|uniref:hypothetical protein n=1 Tax=Humibacter sp. RRB41 TaxID=2919946 RepID=UPI001FAA1A9B|nr:hypothetical protein [Humibacter sp. RRB41]
MRKVRLTGMVATQVAAVLVLAGCSTAAASSPPHAPHTTAATVHEPDQSIATTCLTLETVNTSLLDAASDRDQGTYTDAQYAAVINTVPMTLHLLDLAHLDGTAGLAADVGLLEDAIKSSPAIIAGAQFDPGSAAYRSALSSTVADCATNQTPIRNIVQGG